MVGYASCKAADALVIFFIDLSASACTRSMLFIMNITEVSYSFLSSSG